AKVGLCGGNRTVRSCHFCSRKRHAARAFTPVFGFSRYSARHLCRVKGRVRLICRFSLSAPFMGLPPQRIGGKRRPVNGPDKVITVWNRTDRTGGFTLPGINAGPTT